MYYHSNREISNKMVMKRKMKKLMNIFNFNILVNYHEIVHLISIMCLNEKQKQ